MSVCFLQHLRYNYNLVHFIFLSLQAIQNMGNLGLQLGLGKELWMAPLHPFIKESIRDIKGFIDRVIQIDEDLGKWICLKEERRKIKKENNMVYIFTSNGLFFMQHDSSF